MDWIHINLYIGILSSNTGQINFGYKRQTRVGVTTPFQICSLSRFSNFVASVNQIKRLDFACETFVSASVLTFPFMLETFSLVLYVPVNNFSVTSGHFPRLNQDKVSAQGHNMVPLVKLKPALKTCQYSETCFSGHLY